MSLCDDDVVVDDVQPNALILSSCEALGGFAQNNLHIIHAFGHF